MHEPDFLLFASDATLVGVWGLGFLTIAFLAWLGERRRARRRQIDAVGWVPWTTLFLVSFFPGVVLVAMAAVGLLKG